MKDLKLMIQEDRGVNLPNFLNPEILKYAVEAKIKEQVDSS